MKVLPEIKDKLEEARINAKNVHIFLGLQWPYQYRIDGIVDVDDLANFYLGHLVLEASEEKLYRMRFNNNGAFNPFFYVQKANGKMKFTDRQNDSLNTVFTSTEAASWQRRYPDAIVLEEYHGHI